MCQKISILLRGKHKPTFRNNSHDQGDRVIVVNAKDIMLTGKKALQKEVIYHTGNKDGIVITLRICGQSQENSI